MKFPKRHIAENLCDLGLGKKKKLDIIPKTIVKERNYEMNNY